ncbi:MAG: glycosyltransferase 87 family protein [Candidatus Rokuibacteriota bacterium]
MTRRDPSGLCLIASAALLAAAFGGIAWLGNLFYAARSFVGLFVLASLGYALAVMWVVRTRPTRPAVLAGILGVAVAFRLILLPTEPTLSTDAYRYLWDGRLAAAGISPYHYPPNASEVAAFRDATVYPRLNHADWRTVYPPGAQLLFWAVARLAPDNILALKTVMLAFDLLTLGLLIGWLRALGRPLAWALLYAWHPLVVVELSGSGHLDAAALAASVAALWAASRERETWAGALVGAGALIKLYPLLLLAAITRGHPARALAACGAVVLAGYGLYAHEGAAVLGSLTRYVAEEEFNPSVRLALEVVLAPFGPPGLRAARLLPLIGLAGVVVGAGLFARAVPVWRRALWIGGGYLLTVPSLFPWYALWVVPLLAAAPAWPWLYLTCAVGLTYVIFAEPVWRLPLWVTAAQFVPVALGLAFAWRSRDPAGSASGAREGLGEPRSDGSERPAR